MDIILLKIPATFSRIPRKQRDPVKKNNIKIVLDLIIKNGHVPWGYYSHPWCYETAKNTNPRKE